MATIEENAQKINDTLRNLQEADSDRYQNVLGLFNVYKPDIDVEIDGELSGELRQHMEAHDEELLEYVTDIPFKDVIARFVNQGMLGLVAGRNYYVTFHDVSGQDQTCGCWYGHRTHLTSGWVGEAVSTSAFNWLVKKNMNWTSPITPIEDWLMECAKVGRLSEVTLNPLTNTRFLLFLQYLCTRYSQITQDAIA